MNPDLLIACATIPEMAFFLSAHPPESKRLTRTGFTVFSGKIYNKSYDLLITEPGVFNAAHALTVYLEYTSCGLIVQTGIAGVFRETGSTIGDVAIATEEHYIHTGIGTEANKNKPLPFDLIESFPLSREGRYAFDPARVEACHEKIFREFLNKGIRVTKGPFTTVSTITSSFREAALRYMVYSSVMEAMEGAAVAHIATLYKTPVIEIRAASNFVGERDKTKWDMEKAAKHLGMVFEII